MGAKIITAEHVANTLKKIEQGEMPKRNTKISQKEFAAQMLPHVKRFLAQGYTYKEVADFLGHITASDLKKAVEKGHCAEAKEHKKASKKAVAVAHKEGAKHAQAAEKTAAPLSPGKENTAKKPANPLHP